VILNLDWKHFAMAHIMWIAIAVVSLFALHAWVGEHDARLLANQQQKISEAQVKDLQAQIVAVNAAAAQKVQVIAKIIHDVQTPTQAVTVIPQLTDVPLNARVAPDNPTQVSVDAVPLVEVLGQCKIDKTNLDACQANLKSETEIVAQKDLEIKALKKPKSFFKRLTDTMKAVGIGVGIGLLLGAHGL
jgi:cell division protein FtsB